jgi:hypothetical protein
MEREKWKVSMRTTLGAKRLGRTLRESLPDVTWQRVPNEMLRLLVKISEAEARKERSGQADTGRPPSGSRKER